jgi:hypothetical protein
MPTQRRDRRVAIARRAIVVGSIGATLTRAMRSPCDDSFRFGEDGTTASGAYRADMTTNVGHTQTWRVATTSASSDAQRVMRPSPERRLPERSTGHRGGGAA